MQSLSNHIRALVKSIVTVGLLSAVCFTASVATGLAGGIAAQASTQKYSITDLGTLGGSTTVAYGINGNGQIVGKSLVKLKKGYTYHAFLYSAGTMTDLGTLGGDYSEARAINKYGDVAGFSNLCAGCYPYHAFLYHNGHMKDLGSLGGGSSNAYGINDFGEVVGDSYTASNQDHAFLYSGGKMTDLGSFGDASVAEAINTSGVVVGTAYVVSKSTAAWHAFIYTGGTLLDLNTLIPANTGWLLTEATGINDTGQIVCNATNSSGYTHAFLLNPI